MDNIDYLLLDYISELPSAIRFLNSSDIEEIFNKPAHNLSENILAEKLLELYLKGYVKFSLPDNPKKLLIETESVVLYESSIVSLTSLGGEVWESKYEPRWDRFISEEVALIENDKVEVLIGSLCRNTLEKFIEPIAEKQLIPIDLKSNWKALYWKTFEQGYISKFIISEIYYDKMLNNYPAWKIEMIRLD